MHVRRLSSLSRSRHLIRFTLGFLLAGSLIGCDDRTTEDRGREALKKIQEALPDIEAQALEQQVDAGVVEDAQRQLTALKEYQGEVDGKLDSVTVNAIQAFQRTHGIHDDGMLNARTRETLRAAAEKAPDSGNSAG